MDLTADGSSQTSWNPWIENVQILALKTAAACFFNSKGTSIVEFFTVGDGHYNRI
jgi:hypothetical protein